MEIKEAKVKLKETCDEVKLMKKKYKCSNRSADLTCLHRIIHHFGDKFLTKNIQISGLWQRTEQLRFFNLIKSKCYLKGFITAKLRGEER